ncbi:hypothetical protein AVW11_03850 [Streptomyces amritsarensis]|uniref:DNA-binding phage zinc finger domain-containing protein n=1 Tax=Streptomyces amritsarensis TaxID=681158 RepID=A0ABX3G9C9_9ACTN|nr:hypothetical protein [Streptomyces amritsarensis]OLZ72536.1 hypothetical protein AVW11_03850 [Streptomyces amritsarensis]
MTNAPMPAGLRTGRRAPHPARAVRCPHCGAAPGDRCTTRAGRTRVQRLDPCDARLAAWADRATATACCPTCQSAPGYACHNDGTASPVHDARYTEAKGKTA